MGRTLKVVILVLVALNAALVGVALYVKSRMKQWGDEESDAVELVAIMGGLEFASRARSFNGGTVFTMMGGAEIDLRGATLDPDGAYLQVRTYFGGTEIVVPEDWRITFDSRAYLGGADGPKPPADLPEDAPRLTIEALTVFGGLDVKRKPAQKPEENDGE
jgi:predicted membrane protein